MKTYIQEQVELGTSRDLIVIGLVTEHKLTLSKAQSEVSKYYKENGLTKVITSYKDDAMTYLHGIYDAVSWDHKAVADMVIQLQSEFDVAESTARDYTKAFSTEELGVAHPKLDPRMAIFEWFKHEAPLLALEERKPAFLKFATDLGRSKSNANEYWKGYELHMFLVA